MPADGAPKFRRRKAERPAEILAAAMAVFAERGFAGARLEDVAARAGVSKGAIYLYFATKEEVFRAVVDQSLAPDIEAVKAMAAAHQGPFPDLLRLLVGRMVGLVAHTPVGGVAKMVIGEARNFPELARVWHDRLVSQAVEALTLAVAAAQARGEVRAGDPRLFALQIVAPLLIGVIWRETFTPIGAPDVDIEALAAQHLDTLLDGLMLRKAA
ncbi:TetR/AcrR family transcriptional regulator [Phenylobacterium sp.]|jgi:AcrR family transcriptional regulator|uniref:TetR/AcrR family transcriptional regulator n=1 Tax=Phenylobacterium sp. TaxID=1871053 RepID=UPI002F42DFB0